MPTSLSDGNRRYLLLALIVLFTRTPQNAFSQQADSTALTWVAVHSSSAPEERLGPAMTYDPVSRLVVLFGGFDGHAYRDDTWVFEGAQWKQLHPLRRPPARTAAEMSYDAPTRRIVLFGGYAGSRYLGDTWLWDGASGSWTQAHPTTSPVPVTGPSVVTDPLTGHALEYGGFDGRFYQLETSRWTGTNWTFLHTKNSPTARAGAVAAVDVDSREVLLFDGLADVNPYNTWTWDGNNWNKRPVSLEPPSRYNAAGAYDPKLRAVVVFGGGHGFVDLNDTWKWTGSAWKQLFPAMSPPPREWFGMALDHSTGHIVIFGGQFGKTLLGDTWILNP